MKDLISIIINVYNAEKYIANCLESAINQTYENIEIIIINDGSTDSSLQICESYRDERIRIINQENMGLSKSRNVGIDNANGEYLYFIDADDFIENDTIEYLYNLAKKYNVLLATSKPKDIFNYNYINKKQKEKIKILSSKEMLKKVLLSTDRAGAVWNKLIRKEVFENIRFEDRIINDVVVVYKMILNLDKVVFSNQKKYYYLHHKESILGKKKPEHSMDLYKAALERYDYVKSIYPNLTENRVSINIIISNLYFHNNQIVEDFLKKQNAFKVYNEKFTIKLLFCKMKFKDKIKLILFRISPRLCNNMVKLYLKLK